MMHPANIFELFELAALSRPVFNALPFDPLALVAAPDATPKLILSYDHHGAARVVHDVPRVAPACTHVNVTIVPGSGQAPVCVGFGAACQLVTLEGDSFRPVNPQRQSEAKEVYGVLEGLPGLLKIVHPNLTRRVAGQVIDEAWRYADSFMSLSLRHDRQIAGALQAIEEWTLRPPEYEVRSLRGKNCKDFAGAVLDGAGVDKPFGWSIKPWPGMDALAISTWCGGKLKKWGEWVMQPTAVTQMMESKIRRTAQDMTALSRQQNGPAPRDPWDNLSAPVMPAVSPA